MQQGRGPGPSEAGGRCSSREGLNALGASPQLTPAVPLRPLGAFSPLHPQRGREQRGMSTSPCTGAEGTHEGRPEPSQQRPPLRVLNMTQKVPLSLGDRRAQARCTWPEAGWGTIPPTAEGGDLQGARDLRGCGPTLLPGNGLGDRCAGGERGSHHAQVCASVLAASADDWGRVPPCEAFRAEEGKNVGSSSRDPTEARSLQGLPGNRAAPLRLGKAEAGRLGQPRPPAPVLETDRRYPQFLCATMMSSPQD